VQRPPNFSSGRQLPETQLLKFSLSQKSLLTVNHHLPITTNNFHVMRILFFCLFLAPAAMLAQGVQFESKAWADILAKAKAGKKLVFLDAYASWCGPCKQMSKQTFTDSQVGKFFNTSFVNAKIDMEKGEGPELATRYQVEAYPTLLFVDGDGVVVHRALGYHDVAQFIALGTTANDPAKNQRSLDQRYAKGDRDPVFIASYLAAKADASDPGISQIAADYLKTQKDWATAANMEIILHYANDPKSEPFAYFMKNRPAFTTSFGEEAVAGKSQIALRQYLEANPEATLSETQAAIRQIMGGEQGEKLANYYPVLFYHNTGAFDEYAQAAVAYFDKYPPTTWNELNEMAWSFHENVSDPKMLEVAAGWAKKSVEMEANYYNTDTLAALYAKLGNNKEAIKYAEMAIDLAKKSGDDYSGTENLLKSLKK